ncbi:unnamed protein product [Clonostachys solani]|uniref:Rhodopsin domain-containing protein n=1 Tax=Clonostachys solani TaxID=160281 RepID=A0A9N9ZKN7_9HYPO|nr:unnamed protein product [Clonostachys solani]
MGSVQKVTAEAIARPVSTSDLEEEYEKKSLKRRIREIVWDSLDRSPEERRMIAKLDFFILTWASLAYFSKNLNSNNLSNAYVSGMKEELPVIGNEYQTLTTMWTIGYVVSQIPSQLVCTRELAKRSCIFFATAFIGSMFSGYLQAALHTGMNGVHGLSGWRWLFIFDGVITLPMALWAYYALPDLPSTTRVKWLKPEEKEYFLQRMKKAGRDLEEPVTIAGLKRVVGKWHFWVYTTYYTFFICSENIGSFMNLWLKSLNRYTVPQINTYPTVTNAVTIITTLAYGWTSDALQIRAPIIYFSLVVCFFAAMNLAIWDGVPFGLKWASFYLTGFAQGSGPIFFTMVNEQCAGDSLERKFILGTTNSIAYAFNAWIPLITYNTNYAPRFLVGNATTVALIVGAAITITVAVRLQNRDAVLTHFRLGQAPKPMDPDQVEEVLVKVRKLLWVNELMYASTIAFSKLSFISLYWRIFKLTMIRIPICLLLVACSAWFIIRTFAILFQCWPVPYIWDKTIKGGTCKLNISQFLFGTVLTHCLMDITILVLPVFPVVKMHLSWQQKVGIIGLFASGIIVVSCSVLVLIQVIMYKPLDANYTLSLVKFTVWGNAEAVYPYYDQYFAELFPERDGAQGLNWDHLNEVRELLE